MEENNKINYKVLITTSGIGSRLGELTKYTNKSLVRVGKKPALSYIIEAYPKDIPIIITIGYFGNQVRDFVELVYSERNIEFVEVDNYDGSGSSLGYSMLKAKEKLQCPFVYHAGDTITFDNIPAPVNNWVGGFKSDDSSHYATLNVMGNNVIGINDKGAQDFDYIHIGLIGVREYSIFWNALEEIYNKNKEDSKLNDVSVINKMVKNNESEFNFLEFNFWLDIGNIKALNHARKNIKDNDGLAILDKNSESIFIFDDFVVKFFYDKRHIEERVKRARYLSGLTPEIEGVKDNFYRYKYAPGDIYSRSVRPSNFVKFLEWSENNLWKNKDCISSDKFKKNCYGFYYEKTMKRIEKMMELEQIKDKKDIINGEEVPAIKKLMEKIDFDYLSDAEQSQFHGDFILDNIIYNKDSYKLIDWRQNFGGHLYAGDKYYDLAKLNHNLTVNHDIIRDNFFTVNIEINGEIYCDIMRKENLVACQKVYHEFLLTRGYDSKKVKILTALIWLNMSPLHHHPFNIFLYYFGKLNLWRSLQEK